MNSFKKLNREKLLNKKIILSPLKDEHLSNEVHENAKKFWNEFEIKAEGDRHDFSLKADVLQHSFSYKHILKTSIFKSHSLAEKWA